MAAIKVSEAEFKRLEALLKMEETGQRKKTGADVAGEALSFGKKIVVGYLIAGAVLFLICMVIVLPWMIRGFSQLDAQNAQVRSQQVQMTAQIKAADAAREKEIARNDEWVRVHGHSELPPWLR